jgi:hypothetical protein
VQPRRETLVNLETIFYAEPPVWTNTVQLLGYSVDVEATVASYNWSFGDGAEMTTNEPGAPYPAMDVVHEYRDAHVTVRPRVDVSYRVRYRVDGGAWQSVDEMVDATGYSVALEVREGSPLLVGSTSR